MIHKWISIMLKPVKFCVSVSLPKSNGFGSSCIDCPVQQLPRELLRCCAASVTCKNVECGSGHGPCVQFGAIALKVMSFKDSAPLIIPHDLSSTDDSKGFVASGTVGMLGSCEYGVHIPACALLRTLLERLREGVFFIAFLDQISLAIL
jgi:hypothetical protein